MKGALIAMLLAAPLLGQAPNGWAPIENGWAEIQTAAPTGTVTTTGTLASGQVALGSGATSITGDAGLTYSGTGTGFVLGIGTDVFLRRDGPDTLAMRNGTAAQMLSIGGPIGSELQIYKASASGDAWIGPVVGANMYLGTGNVVKVTILANGTGVTFAVPLRLKGYTVATLPAGTVGDTAYVTDATAPTYLGALTGGGAVTTPVFYNGAAWVSH